VAEPKIKAVRLTPPMVELLTDLVTNPEMYVRTYGRWGRTAEALRDRGLATLHWCEGNQTMVIITKAGRVEAARREIVDSAPKPYEDEDDAEDHRSCIDPTCPCNRAPNPGGGEGQ
jgi:hypothetical protein